MVVVDNFVEVVDNMVVAFDMEGRCSTKNVACPTFLELNSG